MRTTVTLDDDVASILRPLLAQGKPKKVMNELLRKALGIRPKAAVELPAFALGLRPGFDPAGLNRLAEELALEADRERLDA